MYLVYVYNTLSLLCVCVSPVCVSFSMMLEVHAALVKGMDIQNAKSFTLSEIEIPHTDDSIERKRREDFDKVYFFLFFSGGWGSTHAANSLSGERERERDVVTGLVLFFFFVYWV